MNIFVENFIPVSSFQNPLTSFLVLSFAVRVVITLYFFLFHSRFSVGVLHIAISSWLFIITFFTCWSSCEISYIRLITDQNKKMASHLVPPETVLIFRNTTNVYVKKIAVYSRVLQPFPSLSRSLISFRYSHHYLLFPSFTLVSGAVSLNFGMLPSEVFFFSHFGFQFFRNSHQYLLFANFTWIFWCCLAKYLDMHFIPFLVFWFV